MESAFQSLGRGIAPLSGTAWRPARRFDGAFRREGAALYRLTWPLNTRSYAARTRHYQRQRPRADAQDVGNERVGIQ